MTPEPAIEPGQHWWEVIALTTAPSQLPLMTGSFDLCGCEQPK